MSKVKGKHKLGGNAQIIKGANRKDSDLAADGTGWLNEPVPNFLEHNNETIIKAKCDNNAMIRLGRDRFSRSSGDDKSLKEIPAQTPTQRQAESGFSAFDGAGAIDIVVGRGAPYPFDSGISTTKTPMYTTKVLKGTTIEGGIPKLDNKSIPEGVDHPMIFMDAARIYISQMCYPDKYFNIKNPTQSGTIDKNPCSAIVIKGDKIRMHARRDIKIVAGTDKGDKAEAKIDSNGYPIRDDQGRIYLMKNEYATCTPAVRGDKLVELLKSMMNTQKSIIIMLNNLTVSQMKFNGIQGAAFYATPSGPTTGNPICEAAAILDVLENTLNIFNQYFEGAFNIPMNELLKCSPVGEESILSKHVFIS